MNRNLIVRIGVSAAIIACLGLCSWQPNRRVSVFVGPMDAKVIAAAPPSTTSRVADCTSFAGPELCVDPMVTSSASASSSCSDPLTCSIVEAAKER